MKTNEAPKKFYFTANENGTHYYTEGMPFEREYVEYIRTDAFIENACEWLLSQEEMIGISFEDDFIERFKEAMKE